MHAWQELADFWFATHNFALASIVGFFFLAVFLALAFWAIADISGSLYESEWGRRLTAELGLENHKKRQQRNIRLSIKDEINQFHAVQNYNGFRVKRIFNKEETPLFYLIKDIITRAEFKNWHVHGQVSFGEIIKTISPNGRNYDADRSHKSINSKRSDMLIVDNFGEPAVIIEYQGAGHWGANRATTEIRDKIKKIVAAKAGLALVEIFPAAAKEEKIRLIENAMRAHLNKSHKSASKKATT